MFSSKRKKEREQTKHFLLAYLRTVLVKQDWDEVSRIKEKLKLLLKEDSMGFVVRSRFGQNAEEERASLFHAGREIKNTRNNIQKLKREDIVLSDPHVIEEEVIKYFEALFNGYHDTSLRSRGFPFVPDNSNISDLLSDLSVMTSDESLKLEVPISIEELECVVKECKVNKAPGLDGLSYEFYRCTWPVIKDTFLDVLQCQLERTRLVKSDTIGATRLIPKVEGIPQVDQLRPITLLNCDYKLMSKVLVRRMRPVMPQIIKSGQLCSVGKKNILFGVFNLLSSILYFNQKNMGGCLLSLDFYKAYDRVFVPFLLLVMEKMGFGVIFRSWIKMLHKDASTRFLLGKLSKAIKVSFSIRQGDPLSMLLYIIFIEPLLIFIEKRAAGSRILLPPGSISLSSPRSQCTESYCDDVNVLTTCDADLVLVDEAVKKFELVSGAILSRNFKCQILGIGRWSKRKVWPLQYLRSVEEVKVFGVFINNSYKCTLKRNWDHRYRKFEKAIFSWSSRILDLLIQRVEVVRIFALSRVFYLASILPMSKTMGAKFEKLTGKFIWNNSGKVLRVSLHDLKLTANRGGLDLLCVFTMSKSLILSQFLRLLKYGEQRSLRHVAFWLGDLLGDLDPDLLLGEHSRTAPPYFQQLALVVTDAKIAEIITTTNWKDINNRYIYQIHLASFSATKVEQDTSVFGLEKAV